MTAVFGEHGAVHSFSIVEGSSSAVVETYAVQIVLYGRCPGSIDDNAASCDIEAQKVDDDALVPLGDTSEGAPFTEAVEIEIVVSGLLAPVDKLVTVPWQEGHGVLWLDVLGMADLHELSLELAGLGIKLEESGMVLVAVDIVEQDMLAVGRPADAGIVLVRVVAGLKPYCAVAAQIVDAHAHLVACLAGHRVLDGLDSGDAGADVYERVVGYHRLVHTVEAELAAVGTPEGTLADAKLVSVDGLAVYDFAAAVVAELDRLAAACGGDVEIVVLIVGEIARRTGVVLPGDRAVKGAALGDALALPVVGEEEA